MILKKCYVQDFGKLHEYTLDLNSGLNKINEQNGWGKSTLAAFLKAMLFGMNSTTKRDLDENERQKYTPWDKNKFGGFVEFELDGKNYRLERWFGTKQSQDSATLFDLDLNKVCQTYTPNIMEEYFGINAETFERSTYISQGKISTELNDGLRAKLGNLLQNESENNFKRAIDIVVERRKEKQLFKGKGGEIEEVRTQIDQTTKKISQCIEKKNLLTQKQQELEQLETQTKQSEQKLELTENQLKQLDQKHAKNAEIEHLESLQKQLEDIKTEYEQTSKFFNNLTPDKQTLLNVQNDINTLLLTQTQLENIQTNQNIEFEELNKKFSRHIPDDFEIEHFVDLAKQLDEKEKQTFEVVEQKNEITMPKTNFQLYSIVGIVGVMLGVVLGVVANLIAGILVGVFGIVCAIFGFVANSKQKQKLQDAVARQNLQKQRQLEEVNKQTKNKSFEILQLKQQLDMFVSTYNTPTGSYLFDLASIKSSKQRFEFLKKQQQKTQQQKESLNSNLIATKNNLDRFFANYFENSNQNYQTMLNQIELNLLNFERQKQQMQKANLEIEKYIKLKNIDITKKITQADLQKYDELNNQKNFLLEQLKQQNAQKGQLVATIKTLSEEVLNMDLFENELKNLKAQAQDILDEVEVLDNVKKYLESANETLTSKYISPMTKKFDDYLQLLSSTDLGKVAIDTDMNLTFEQKGAMRDKKYLSAGYRDIVDLCMRFALIDAIFKEEKPTIILDDPFINLDEKNVKKGLELLEKISQDKQIVYFVCHPSRI